MKLFKNHKKRVEKVKDFAAKNKVFIAMMIFAVVFLLVNFVFTPQSGNDPQTANSEIISEYADYENHAVATENPRQTWRFYWIDLVVLVAGGGFCTIMIIRQRRRTREGLK